MKQSQFDRKLRELTREYERKRNALQSYFEEFGESSGKRSANGSAHNTQGRHTGLSDKVQEIVAGINGSFSVIDVEGRMSVAYPGFKTNRTSISNTLRRMDRKKKELVPTTEGKPGQPIIYRKKHEASVGK